MDKEKLKNVVLNFIVPIVCLVLSAILFLVIIYPSYRNMPQLRSELTATTQLRDQLMDKETRLNRFIDFKAILEENSDLVDKVMPMEQNIPGLLDQVNQIADESGLEVTRLSYSVADTSDLAEAPLYSVVLVSLGADGTYAQMISFMEAIENASRYVSISNFRFSSVNSDDDSKLSYTYVLSAPFMTVQSSAVTDEPLTLDIASPDFISFINKVKSLRYFEKSGDLSNIRVEVIEESIEEAPETTESTSSL